LGLEAHTSDLNPVAVLINKAMIESPRFPRQSAGLWFFVIILFAWVGIGNPSSFGKKWHKYD